MTPAHPSHDPAHDPDADLVADLPVDLGSLREVILAWYDARGRRLPFRGAADPYAVLVSEAMAQQTQIARVGPAWGAFLANFPTVGALADAPLADVLRAWRGLGHNRRAAHLHRAARAIVEEHGGRVPDDPAVLQRLPGVGPYTARAVASIAFGRRVGAVDTNVRRVLGRVSAGDADALSPAQLQRLADEAVPADRAADWTHAVMDVGAVFCRPRDPGCGECPARPWCRYASERRSTPAGAAASPRPMPRRPPNAVTFRRTSRWLRGRIVERLTGAGDGAWTRFDRPIGDHPPESVATALLVLAAEGLVELHPSDAALARLPGQVARLPGQVDAPPARPR